jgi:hypothetical protein
MANQEGVDIIIKATDQYTATINKIAASNELFGKSVKNNEKEIAALEKYMVTLRVNGIDPADASMVKLKNDYDNLNKSINSGNGSLKDANKKWTSLALVVQDLPYGFRGIQNNLPALFGSIASAAGPAYFAFSALVALVTAYEKEIRALFITTTAAEKQQELYNNVVKESGSAYVDAQTEVISLTEKVKLAKQGYIDKQSVINDYNDTIGKTIGEQKTLEGVNQALINQGPAYVDYMNKLAMAVAASKLVAQETENIIKMSTKSAGEFVDGWDAFFNAKFNFGGIVQSMVASSEATIKVGEKNKKSQLTLADQTRVSYVKIMQDMYKAAGEAAKKAGVVPGVDPNAKKAPKPTVNKYFENQAQEEFNFYKDSIFEAQKYYNQLNNIQKINAIMEASIKGASTDELLAIQATYKQKALNFEKEQQSKIFEELHKGQQLNKKLSDDYNKEKIDAQVSFTQTYIKSLDAQLRAELRLHKGNVNLQQEDIKGKIAYLKFAQVFSAGNIKSTENINAALLRLNGTLTGVGTNWANTANKIVSISNDFLANSFVSLGETLGKALAGEKVQPFVALAGILADALTQLGQALISFAILEGAAFEALKNPASWPIALAAGVAAVAAGALLKSTLSSNKTKKFANGGIISGPTMGLMGEYPGASSNPEVVAPLDKLKDMIGGGGGGTFVLKGQDLLLSVNRAQKASNIKGQNISLA